MDVAEYRHGRYFFDCNPLIIRAYRKTKEKMYMLLKEKHQHRGIKPEKGSISDDGFLILKSGRGNGQENY